MNIADRLRDMAAQAPGQAAVHEPHRTRRGVSYRSCTFRQLEDRTTQLAVALGEFGIRPGTRIVLFVPFSIAFIELTFALFKAGAVVVLIDPGMGRTNILSCLERVRPEGFVAVPRVHAARSLMRSRFPQARLNVTVGRRWFWGGTTLAELERRAVHGGALPTLAQDDPAAIIFTSGSTGPPKGVCYEHGMFDAQVRLIRDFYGIETGEIDLPGFPLFGLFNAAMGVTTVIPEMDPTRPVDVDPCRIVDAIERFGVTQVFGSPAFWNRVGRHCEEYQISFPNVRRALSAGGPVPTHVLERVGKALTAEGADFHTPYGATESLPVASIGGREILASTAPRTRNGAGTCVGRPFPEMEIKIIEPVDGPIAALSAVHELPVGEIGEIIVRGPSVTRAYADNPLATTRAKIADESSRNQDRPRFWHRIGDVGYCDSEGLLWFCGRKDHIVETSAGPMYPVRCEPVFNEHPRVYRSALVALGEKPQQRPVLIVEPEPGQFPEDPQQRASFLHELREIARNNPLTCVIDSFLFHPSLPVDTRHNVKINRPELVEWARTQL